MAAHYPEKVKFKPPVLCIDCKHCECLAARYLCRAATSLVTGQHTTIDCAAMRLTTGQCGPSGKLFTPIPAV